MNDDTLHLSFYSCHSRVSENDGKCTVKQNCLPSHSSLMIYQKKLRELQKEKDGSENTISQVSILSNNAKKFALMVDFWQCLLEIVTVKVLINNHAHHFRGNHLPHLSSYASSCLPLHLLLPKTLSSLPFPFKKCLRWPCLNIYLRNGLGFMALLSWW